MDVVGNSITKCIDLEGLAITTVKQLPRVTMYPAQYPVYVHPTGQPHLYANQLLLVQIVLKYVIDTVCPVIII